MSASIHATPRRQPRRREPVELPEPARPDPRLAELGRLRALRSASAERQQQALRAAWRRERAALHEATGAWREADRRAHHEWGEARAAFFAMRSTSGQFRAAKARYERACADSALQRAALHQAVDACRVAGRSFFAACAALRAARKRQETFALLEQELARQAAPDE